MKRTFLDLFNSAEQKLEAKFDVKSGEPGTIITIKNKLVKQDSRKGLAYIESICRHEKLQEFAAFYEKYDGFDLAKPARLMNWFEKPLFHQFAAADIAATTKKYMPGGEWAWTIDLNKSRSLYRVPEAWVVFARVDAGPNCLTIFLEGENAGNIYLLQAQPSFNILKPIAKSYNAMLERIEKDPAAFLKLLRCYVTIHKDNQSWGYVPTRYIDKFSPAP